MKRRIYPTVAGESILTGYYRNVDIFDQRPL